MFTDPATEYVAAFIGMSNRVPAHFTDGSWKVGTSDVMGAMLHPSEATSDVIVRVRPDDARLAAAGSATLGPHEAGIAAVVADVEFGGKHLDVTVDVDTEHRFHVQADLRRSEDLHTTISRGDQVVFVFDTTAARYFDASESFRRPAEAPRVEVIA